MKVLYKMNHRIRYCEVDQRFRLRLGALFRLLHEATAEHWKLLGTDMRAQQRSGYAWAVRKIALRLSRLPEYDEQLHVSTWIHQFNKIMMRREFEITAGGKEVAMASSEWVCLDLRRRKISRHHPPTLQNFQPARTAGVDQELQRWTRPQEVPAQCTREVRVRSADFDSNGHVNNATYFEYLESLLAQCDEAMTIPLKLGMHFTEEIGPDIPAVTLGLMTSEHSKYFKIYNQDTIYALGEILIPSEEYSEVVL